MRCWIAGAIVAAGLLGGRAALAQPAHEPTVPALVHVHDHHGHGGEGGDPILPFLPPDCNCARMRRGEGPIHKHPAPPLNFENTGHPERIAPWAVPARTGPYYGYYVGGGAKPSKGECRYPAAEGTWGWDYVGGILPRRVALLWSHGRLYQDGQGRYKNTYPIEYRNPLYRLESPRLYFEGKEGHESGEAEH